MFEGVGVSVGKDTRAASQVLPHYPEPRSPEYLFDLKQMPHPQQLAPLVLLIKHMCPLARENPHVIRVAIAFVTVVVMDDLTGL